MGKVYFTALCELLLATFLLLSPAQAADIELQIKDHRFEPARLVMPAGERIRVVVRNLDATPEEFESYELNREKIIPGKAHVYIYIGPLEAGTYPFFGEFHEATAQGHIVAE